ncbi:MAG TPA: glycine--tRNA ligase subunit beta [Coleofasciculaceae cyanobacterium]
MGEVENGFGIPGQGVMATFLLEVGTEELPADFVTSALEQWRSRVPQSLSDVYLHPASVTVYGTPRRLAVLVEGLPLKQPDQTEAVKGPPAAAAFKEGKPTPALVGFAKKQGVAVADVEVRPTDKGDFVFVCKTLIGRPATEILTDLVPQWITGLEGKRLMRWGDGDLRFPRPIRWLVALLDDTVLPLQLINGSKTCTSDRFSQGHRVLHPSPVEVPTAGQYVEVLSRAFVDVDAAHRQTVIQDQIKAAAQQLGGTAVINPELLEEVTQLVEWPTAVVGKFDPAFLSLPSEVITTEMESHQRYFPVLKGANSGELLPYFITISNGDPDKSTLIATGNERVIRARLSDGKFFFDSDSAKALEYYLPQLETVTFQENLGSLRARVDRISRVADQIADQLKIKGETRQHTQRAALLCKADLVTQMVGEFPELQGVMGEKYARKGGEPEAVAIAIGEHYLPRGAGDRLPQTLTGQVVGIADRLDTLVSIFGLGMVPTGSSDPFALRRAANAIVNVTWAANLQLNLQQLLQQVIASFAQAYPSVMKPSVEELQQQLQEFFLQRVRTLLQEDRGVDYDLVNAVLGEDDPVYAQRALDNLLDLRDRAEFLQSLRQNGTLAEIYETVNRASRLAKQGQLDTQTLDPEAVIQPKLLQKSSEQAMYNALIQLNHQTRQAEGDYTSLVEGLKQIAPAVSAFFDGPDSVLVMDPDLQIRTNRLNLLGVLRNQARSLADFGAVVKS